MKRQQVGLVHTIWRREGNTLMPRLSESYIGRGNLSHNQCLSEHHERTIDGLRDSTLASGRSFNDAIYQTVQ